MMTKIKKLVRNKELERSGSYNNSKLTTGLLPFVYVKSDSSYMFTCKC
mgnify:FL=1